MNIQEAYSTLDVQDNISDIDLKSIYKKLAVKYHPDRFKDDPDKFKKINEAYQLITDYRKNPEKYNPPSRSPFGGGGFNINLNDIFGGGFGRSQQTEINAPPINLSTKISFKESVLGVEKEIAYKKTIKCDGCDGKGKEPQSNGCKSCNGFGRVVQQQGNMHYSSSCNKCHGQNVKFKDCIKCKSKGALEVDVNAKINVPPCNSTILRIQGAGHYMGSAGPFGDAYSDVFLNVTVEPDVDLKLDGNNVVCNLQLSLIDALTGCSKQVRTIYDTRTVDIPAKSKNRDEVVLSGCGVKQANGSQRVILNIDYGDVDKLIEFLKQEGK
jgi:molecular chaperone DnaJ